MQPAVGTAKKLTGILMGAETIDQYGKSFILVVPDVSVYRQDVGVARKLGSIRRPADIRLSDMPESWAKRDEHGDLSTANNRMQPAFAGSYKTVAIPFGSRVTGYLPREHPLVKNGSFGDRFVEGIYFRADHDTPCIRMYCITSGSELLVQDFKSYPDEFLFRDPSCLLRCTPVILKDLAKIHIDDAHDDNLVAEETALHAHTRAQTRAADAAKALDEPIILTTSSDAKTIDQIAPPPRAFAPPPTKSPRRCRAPK